MSTLQSIIGRQPTELGTNFSTDDFSISKGSVHDGTRYKQLKSLNAPSVTEFMKKFNGWTGDQLVNSYLSMSPEDMSYAWGADVNINDFMRTEAYAVGLGRIMVGGSLTDLQTKNYVGLGLMSKMLLPDGIPEENAVFTLEIVYDQMTMALPGAIRALSADVNAWKTSLRFGLTQYTTSIQFLQQELTYLVKGEPVTALARRKFGQMMNRFRLSIIHSHAQAAVRQPSFVETIIGRQINKSIVSASAVVYNMAKAEALMVGLCSRNPLTMRPLIEMALMSLTGNGELDNSTANYFAAMNSHYFSPGLVTHTAVVSTVMPAYTYNTSRDRVEAAQRSEILSVAWEDAVIKPVVGGPVSSVSPGYTPSLAVPADSIPTGSVSLPAVVLDGGAVVPLLLFDGTPICRDGPSMGRPFVSNGLQYRWFTVGVPAPIISGLSPSTLFDDSESKPITPATLMLYSPRSTCVFDEHGDTRYVELSQLHIHAEVADLWDIGKARARFNSLPPEVRSARRVEAYLKKADILWGHNTQQKLQSMESSYEFSPRFMLALHKAPEARDSEYGVIVKERDVMWNTTAMSSPSVEGVAIAAELYNYLGLNDPELKSIVKYVQACGASADEFMLRDCVILKMICTKDLDLGELEEHHGTEDGEMYLLNFHARIRQGPQSRSVSKGLAYEVLCSAVPRFLNRLLGGTGHLLLTDPYGWHILGHLLNYFEDVLDDTDGLNMPMRHLGYFMTREKFSALIKIKDSLSYLEAAVLKWLQPLVMPSDPYVYFGETSPIATRWSWMCSALFDSVSTFGTEHSYVLSTVTSEKHAVKHATCAGSLAFVGTNLPINLHGMVDHNQHGQTCRRAEIAGVHIYGHSPAAFLFQVPYNPQTEAEHDNVIGCLGRSRATMLRRNFNTCPQVALALAAHYSLLCRHKNVANFDKMYYSGWSYAVVRRMEFDSGGLSVMPVQSHLMVVGNSNFDLSQQLGLDRQFALRSMMRYAVVPMGVFGQGVYFPNAFIKSVRGLGLDYVNAMQHRQRFGGMNNFDLKTACMSAFIMDWASSLHPPIQGSATGVGPILSANGRFSPQLGDATAAEYFRQDPYNLLRFYSTCPFQNTHLNEGQANLFKVLSQLGDPNADMFGGSGRRTAVLSTTIKQYHQYLKDTDKSRMGQMEHDLQTRLQSLVGDDYTVPHSFNSKSSMFYVDNSTIGANSDQLLKSPVNMDNRNNFLLMCRTDNITYDPNNTEVPIDKLQLDIQGLNPLRLLDVNPTSRVNMAQQMLNNNNDNAV
ncbi:major capsid protein [Cyprinid herpesvirus 1]|uniref:Major capsid protein n=1 Tax=Cyprinid herpesvirus 1 TaxID=317858 RepID=Q52UN7_9VIRU|nr:major capsid protein [Cyprinid herpesvirus 1]AAX53086.1 major capsid protein [Cyprinid herpesvirus 1]AFJ20389.1 major capsid protein [Cyprinid herpesvirus 1]